MRMTVNFRLIGRLPLETDIDDEGVDFDPRSRREPTQPALSVLVPDIRSFQIGGDPEYFSHAQDRAYAELGHTPDECLADFDPEDDYDWIDEPEVEVAVDSEVDIRPEVLRRLNSDRPGSIDRDRCDGDARRGSGWKANTMAAGQWARHKRWEKRFRGDKVEDTLAFHVQSLTFDLQHEREMLSLRRFLDRIEAAQNIADKNARRRKQLDHQDEPTSSDDDADDEEFYELLQMAG